MIHFTQPNDHVVGTAAGLLMGLFNSIILVDGLSWAAFGSTALLSAFGAIIGFLITKGLKWLAKRISK